MPSKHSVSKKKAEPTPSAHVSTPSPPPVADKSPAPTNSSPRPQHSSKVPNAPPFLSETDAVGNDADPALSSDVSSPVLVLPRVPANHKASKGPDYVLRGGVDGGRGRRAIRVLRGLHQSASAGDAMGTSEEVGGGQLVLGSSAHDEEGALLSGSRELAVVPFVGRMDSSQWALTTHRVCPTCLRPYTDEDEDEDGLMMSPGEDLLGGGMGESDELGGASDHTGHSRHPSRRRMRSKSGRPRAAARPPASVRRLLSPHYFRALEGAQPLAIGDGTDSHISSNEKESHQRLVAPSSSPPGRIHHPGHPLPADRVPRPSPPIYYVSPTGSPEPDAYGFSVDPSDNLGVGWGTRSEAADPPDVRTTTTPHRSPTAKQRADEEEEGLLSSQQQEAQERARRENEEAKQNSSPLLGVNGYYARYFVEVQKLGSGTYGGVYLCQHVMEGVPLGTFALKKVPVGDKAEYLQKVLSEVRILEEVKRHPNVVEYNHSWVEEAQLADFGPPVRCLFILMEYATEGSLDSYLERYGTALSTVAVWYFFLSAIAGTAHLHQKNILHRDLKPQNLLLTGPPGKPPRVLVSDFGTAALLGENVYERTGGTGTLEYMAPELMEVLPDLKEEHYINHHTKASDVWSLGMILYYLACNATLPVRLPDGAVSLGHLQSRSPFARPPEMVELIRAMLQRDPRRRPSCNDILSSTVVQTILRSFNNAAAAGAGGGDDSGFNVITRDIMPCDDRVGSPSSVGAESPTASRVRTFPSHRNQESIDATYDDEEAVGTSPGAVLSQIANNESANDSREESNLQSSRVELMSTTVNTSAQNLMEVPLLMQYRANDAATTTSSRFPSAGAGGSRVPHTVGGGGTASAFPALSKPGRTPPPQDRGSSHTPSPASLALAARRPRMVDAEVQTDPVNIID